MGGILDSLYGDTGVSVQRSAGREAELGSGATGGYGPAPMVIPINIPSPPSSGGQFTTETDDAGNITVYRGGMAAGVVQNGKFVPFASADPLDPMRDPSVIKAQIDAKNALDLQALINAGKTPAAGPIDTRGYGNNLSMGDQMALLARSAESNKLLEGIKAASAEAIAQIQADTSASNADKQVQIAQINKQSAKDAAETAANANVRIAELDAAIQEKKLAAEEAIARGNRELAYAQLQSAEAIAAAKNQLEREVAGLTAYTQLLGIESQERSNKAQAAASIFNSLAQATPGQQLKNAFYFMRGEAPTGTIADNMPKGLLSALGLNPDTVQAAAQQMQGQASAPPFLLQLMKGQLSSAQNGG